MEVVKRDSSDSFCVDRAVEMIESVAKQNKFIIGNEECASILLSEQEVLPTSRKQENFFDDEKSLNATPTRECLLTPTSASKKWDVTTRKILKTRKHPALIVNTQRKLFDKLTKAKLELVHLQKELLEAEILEKKKEWAFKEKERKWKEEEYKLKLEKLRKQLNK